MIKSEIRYSFIFSLKEYALTFCPNKIISFAPFSIRLSASDIILLNGVKFFISQNSKKYKMTIFTSDRKKNAEIALTKLGINKFFSKILGGDSVKKSKPDPEGIINACKSVNISPSNTAYLTDTTNDLVMAKRAEVLYKIGLETGLGSKKELMENSDFVCKDLRELSNILMENG